MRPPRSGTGPSCWSIIPDCRIVASEVVCEADSRVSVALTIIELSPRGDGSLLEQIAQTTALANKAAVDAASVRHSALIEGLERFLGAPGSGAHVAVRRP